MPASQQTANSNALLKRAMSAKATRSKSLPEQWESRVSSVVGDAARLQWRGVEPSLCNAHTGRRERCRRTHAATSRDECCMEFVQRQQ